MKNKTDGGRKQGFVLMLCLVLAASSIRCATGRLREPSEAASEKSIFEPIEKTIDSDQILVTVAAEIKGSSFGVEVIVKNLGSTDLVYKPTNFNLINKRDGKQIPMRIVGKYERSGLANFDVPEEWIPVFHGETKKFNYAGRVTAESKVLEGSGWYHVWVGGVYKSGKSLPVEFELGQ